MTIDPLSQIQMENMVKISQHSYYTLNYVLHLHALILIHKFIWNTVLSSVWYPALLKYMLEHTVSHNIILFWGLHLFSIII